MRYHRTTLTLAALAALCLTPTAGRARGFALYAQAYLDSSRSPAARVTAEVPFKSLVFFKKEGWYDSRYEVYLSIEPLDDTPPHTSVMRGHAVARTYEQTTRIDVRSKTTTTLSLPPGKYRVSAALRVTRTEVVMQRSLELEVPDFLATGIGFGSPVVLMLPPGGDATFVRWSELADAPVADVGAPADMSLALFERRPAVRFQLYVDGTIDGALPCDLFYEVVSPGNNQVLYGRRRVALTGDNDIFVLSFNVDDWDPGSYKINLRALTKDPVRDASASVALNVDVTRAMLGRDFDDTLEILSLIASDEELTGLKEAEPEARAEEWSKFWAARDPDPTTPQNEALEEHLRRVRYVMQAFSGVESGWRSDRGQVYIRHGRPDRVEHATDSRHQGEYEIWRYYSLGRVFVFYDMFGLGDYRLVQGDMF